MSLYIVSSPFTVNATTNNLPFVVSSPSMSMAQYRLVTDIYIPQRSSTRMVRVKTFPSASIAMIDIARIAADHLTYDTPMTVSPGTGSYTNAAVFRIMMGEEYATSPSSSVIAYDGLGAVGEPAFTASFSGSSALGTLYPAVNEYSNLSYNWPQQEWFANYSATGSTPFLTNDPNFTLSGIINAGGTATKKVYDYDYETISLVNDGSYNQGISFVDAKIVSGSTTVFNSSSYYTSSTAPLLHVGIGPANLSASDSAAAALIDGGDWNYIEYDFDFISGDNRRVQLLREDCAYYDQKLRDFPASQNEIIKGRTRFAFINKYGVMDYYNVNNPLEKRSKIKRATFNSPQLSWQNLLVTSSSDQAAGAVFDTYSRGKDNYYTTFVESFKATTDYMNTETSDWLSELIESPAVWIQNELLTQPIVAGTVQYPNTNKSSFTVEAGFMPINIQNASYTWKTNKFSQKLFQYDLSWEMSNVNIGRR
mgnify:FL=1